MRKYFSTGVPAQVEATPTNYQLFNWNNTDLVDSKIENSLGNFDITLSGGALKLYNQSNNWSKYISMVSDIRSVCPLDEFANNFKKRFSDSHVSFYINQVNFIIRSVFFSLKFPRRPHLHPPTSAWARSPPAPPTWLPSLGAGTLTNTSMERN